MQLKHIPAENESAALIIGLSDEGERVTAAGCRISTQPGTVMNIWAKSQDNTKNTNLINKVTASGHISVTEHTHINIAFQNTSMAFEQFIIDSDFASFTIKSRRYVNFKDAGFFIPDSLPQNLIPLYTAHMSHKLERYQQFVDAGIPKEDARFLLPYCLFSNILCSINASEFIAMLRKMLYGKGAKYPEIRHYGEQLLQQAQELIPGIMMDFEKRSADYKDSIHLDTIHISHPQQQGAMTPYTELINYTPNASHKIAVEELKNQFSITRTAADNILKNNPHLIDKIIDQLVMLDDPTSLKLAHYEFCYHNVSIASLTHFTRHRIQARIIPDFVDFNHEIYVIPPTIEADPELKEIYIQEFQDTIREYNAMKLMDVDESDLIYYLLGGNCVTISSDMTAYELKHFFSLRTCNRAQWEIRDFAGWALSLVYERDPKLFKRFGPACIRGNCPEGKMTCGKCAEVRKKYADRQAFTRS